MASTLGEKLRQAREARDISISEVAEQTRISPSYIESIENDDYRPLPGGIFNKGFVKSYAKVVGIDETEALADYARLIAEQEGSQYVDEPKTYRPEVLTDDRRSSSLLLTVIFAVVILGLMTWGILSLVNYIKENPLQATLPTLSNTNNSTNSDTNSNTNTNTNTIAENPTPSNVPSMSNLKVEFKTSGDPISLASVSDGKKENTLLTPEISASFEPKESLKLGFAKSLAPSAQLIINGKPIKLPSSPANPKRIAIEFEINKDNIGQIWQSGEITFGSETQPAASPTATPR